MRHFMTTKNWNSCLKLKTLTTYISVLCASNEKIIQLRIFFFSWIMIRDSTELYIVYSSYFLPPFLLISPVFSFLIFIIFKSKKSHEKHKRADYFSGKEVNIICALTENLRLTTAYTTKFFPRNFISILFYNWTRNLNIIKVPQVVFSLKVFLHAKLFCKQRNLQFVCKLKIWCDALHLPMFSYHLATWNLSAVQLCCPK